MQNLTDAQETVAVIFGYSGDTFATLGDLYQAMIDLFLDPITGEIIIPPEALEEGAAHAEVLAEAILWKDAQA